jgi:plastocyanin
MKTFNYQENRNLIFPMVLFAVSVLLLSSCKSSNDPPSLTTANVTEITRSSAVSGGTITSDGGVSVSSRGVCWGTTANPTVSDNKVIQGNGNGTFTANLTSLTPNTLYYVRAFATNSEGTAYGNQVQFTTLLTSVAALTTTAATLITSTTATSGGEVTDDGGEPVTARGICWGIAENPTIADSVSEDGTGTGVFESNLTELSPNTTYYIRAYATNSVGTAYGTQVTFKTLEAAQGADEVWIEGSAFNPVTITITANTTVKWTNKDGMAHTVTSDTGDFDSGNLDANATYSHTFTTTGTFPYHCSYHSLMLATVIVN